MAKDIPVLPMRAMDEIMLKSPDALMSGYAIEKLLESCVPALKAPKLVSLPDLDVFLLAIRAATNGENMLLTASCPKCGTDNEFTCHLPALLATMTMVDPENPVRLSDEVVIYLRPYNLYNATSVALASYEEARRLQTFENENGTEDPRRKTEINRTIERLAKLNLEMLADCIIKVVVPGAEVTDAAQIGGFLFNTKKSWINKIEKKLNQINDKGIDKTIHAKCQNVECNHEWKTQVEFDPASFFDDNSSE